MTTPERDVCVLVTRPEPGATALAARLRNRGLEVAIYPTARIVANEDTSALDAAITRMKSYDWVVFASGRAVEIVVGRCSALGIPIGILAQSRLLAGPATGAMLEGMGLAPKIVRPRFSAAQALHYLSGVIGPKARVLLPSAENGRDELAVGLHDLGAQVERLALYRTDSDPTHGPEIRELLVRSGGCVITLASPSAVGGLLMALAEAGDVAPPRTLSRHKVVVIGRTTEQECTRSNVAVTVMASETSTQGLVEAVDRALILEEAHR